MGSLLNEYKRSVPLPCGYNMAAFYSHVVSVFSDEHLQIYKPYVEKMWPNITESEMATKNIGFSFILTRKSSKFIYVYYIPW